MTTLSPEQPSAPDVTACPHCGKPDYATNGWCRFCGYYGVLGKCIELESWEQEYDNGEYVGENQQPSDDSWIAAIKALPSWAWYLSGVLAFVALVNVLVHLYTVPGGAYRIVAAVVLLGIGLLVTLATHIYAGIRNLFDDPHFSLTDIAIHPIQLWCTVCLELPRTVRRVSLLWGGVWTIILVHVVVGVPYLRFVDFSDPPPKRQVAKKVSAKEIVAAVAAATATQEPLTLEDALEMIAGDLAGDKEEETDQPDELSVKDALSNVLGDFNDGDQEFNRKEEADPEPDAGFVTKTINAVIIGYTGNRDVIGSLVLAIRSGGKWRVVGTVSQGMTVEIHEQLKSQVGSIRRERPFVKTTLSANWVEPILRARIQADYSEAEDRYEKLTLLQLL